MIQICSPNNMFYIQPKEKIDGSCWQYRTPWHPNWNQRMQVFH